MGKLRLYTPNGMAWIHPNTGEVFQGTYNQCIAVWIQHNLVGYRIR